MSILDGKITAKEYTEKDIPISLPLLYDMGWRFEPVRAYSADVKHPTHDELLSEAFLLPHYYNHRWLENINYGEVLSRARVIRVDYNLLGATTEMGGSVTMVHPAGIKEFLYNQQPIKTWYDLILIQKYLEHLNRSIEVLDELHAIQKSYIQ